MGTVTRPAETVRIPGVCAACVVAGSTVEVAVGVMERGMAVGVAGAGDVLVDCADGVPAGLAAGALAQALSASSKIKNKTWRTSQGTDCMRVMK